jgi:hypothetical protein
MMLGERKEEVDRKEQDLELCMAALAEAQAWALNPRDNHNELIDLVELRGPLRDTEVDCVVSKVLEDLGMSPILGIPRDPCMVDDILGMVDVILECVKEAYDSNHGP